MMYSNDENECISSISTNIHEELGVLDHRPSYYSDVPIGYAFVRGPNVYASEFAGETYYLQEAIPAPILSHEHPDVIDYPVSAFSDVPVEYQLVRGPNIYSSEIAGTTYFLQDAIPLPVLSSSELIEASHLSDISHPSLPTSSVVLDHDNTECSTVVNCNSECDEKVEISKEQINSVKSKDVCKWENNKIIKGGVKSRIVKVKQRVDHTRSVSSITELNENEKTLEIHKSSVQSYEFSNKELNKKMKQEPDSGPLRDRNSVENINYVTYADVLKSNTHRSAEKSDNSKNSSESDKMYNMKKNKLAKGGEIKKIMVKVTKSEEKEKSVVINQICKSKSIEKVQKTDEKLQKVDRHKTSVESDGTSNLELNEKIKRKSKKSRKQDKKSEDNTSAAVYVEVFNPYTCLDKLDDTESFIKDDKVPNLGENKKNNRKVKKRNTKVTHSEENENNNNSTKSINSESYEKFQQTKENKRTITNNELYSLEVNVKDGKSQENKLSVRISEELNLKENTSRQELKKGKTQKFEKSVQNNNFTISNEVSITELNEGSKNTDKYKTSHELCNLEGSKTIMKKCKKRKTRGKINIQHECSIKGNEASTENKSCTKSNEDSYTELNANFQKLEEHKNTVKPQELCNLQEIKTHERKLKKRKKRGKKLVEHSSSVKSEAPNSSLIENINRKDIQNEECESNVNEEIKQLVEHQMCLKSQEDSNFDAKKKNEKVKKWKAKDEITSENKTVNFEEDSDLNFSNKDLAGKKEMGLRSTEADKFSKNKEECSIAESYDINKAIDSFQDTNITLQHFSEYNASKTIREEGEKIKCNFSSSIETFHSNSKAFVELSDPKEYSLDEKSKLKEFDQKVLTSNEKSLSIKTDEFPSKNYHVPSQESNSRADVPVAVSELQNEDSSISAAPIEVKAVKKKRFKRLRKWFNGIFCCVKKNKE